MGEAEEAAAGPEFDDELFYGSYLILNGPTVRDSLSLACRVCLPL